MPSHRCVALYAAGTTKRDGNSTQQLATLTRCAAGLGFAISGVYEDPYHQSSGGPRKALLRLSQDARPGLFTDVLVTSPRRLARNGAQAKAIMESFRRDGCTVRNCRGDSILDAWARGDAFLETVRAEMFAEREAGP